MKFAVTISVLTFSLNICAFGYNKAVDSHKFDKIFNKLSYNYLERISLNSDTMATARPIDFSNYKYLSEELEVLRLINDYRKSIGLRELAVNNYISALAAEHSEYMVINKRMNHFGFLGRSSNIQKKLGALCTGENVAYNYTSPQAVVNGWLDSPGHKENIEGDFTMTGISIKEDADGEKYYTNIFAK